MAVMNMLSQVNINKYLTWVIAKFISACALPKKKKKKVLLSEDSTNGILKYAC